jgi:uncharacterized protein YwgA
MGSVDQGLTTRQAVLLAISAAGGTVEGRTAMQKIMYFVALALDEDFGHRAHYYGPYSREVEYALTQAMLAEDIDERVERFPNFGSGPDIRKYTYELTDQGRDQVRNIRDADSATADAVDETVRSIHSAVPDLEQQTLSMGAKIHFIISEQSEPTPLAKIPALAKGLGWRISDQQVEKSVELLRELDLLAVR